MTQRNKKIRDAAKAAGVPLWRLGEHFGVTEGTVISWLRKPLSFGREQEFLSAIHGIEAGEANE